MSSIASPRTSLTLSSRRTSISNDTTAAQSPASRQRAPAASSRRNRAALRDYYNLKVFNANSDAQTLASEDAVSPVVHNELDQPEFSATEYVENLLQKEDIKGLLEAATGIEREIKTLDGEKKALVYDNYAKLITATDTIRQMRERMDPLTPTTKSLQDDIARIADLAEKLCSPSSNTATANTVGEQST